MLRPLALAAALAAGCGLAAAQSGPTSQGTYTLRSITPEAALKAAQGALQSCQKAGYQVAVAVVDRGGHLLVLLRDRLAGAHTPSTAENKAWTSLSFRIDTLEFSKLTQANEPASGIRHLPKVVAIGGGRLIESAGAMVGAIGISGAPGGEADDTCARAGIAAIQDDLDF
jgi:uncharacterized protein GlcG (DUF336 family)